MICEIIGSLNTAKQQKPKHRVIIQSQIYDHMIRDHARENESFTLSKGAVEDDDQNNVVNLIFEVPKRKYTTDICCHLTRPTTVVDPLPWGYTTLSRGDNGAGVQFESITMFSKLRKQQ